MRDLPRYFANRGFIELFKIYVGLLIHHTQSCALLVCPQDFGVAEVHSRKGRYACTLPVAGCKTLSIIL